jgi:hypothetical protein
MPRYEFGPSSRSWLVRWLSGAFCRDRLVVAGGCADRRGRVVDPPDRLPVCYPGQRPRGEDGKRKAGVDLLDKGPAERLGSKA